MATTINWPSTLPYPLLESWSESEPNLTIGTETDIGPIKTRRRSTAGIRRITCEFLFTRAELTIFKNFYRSTTGYGSVSFNMKHPWYAETNDPLLEWLFVPNETPTYKAVVGYGGDTTQKGLFRVGVNLFQLVGDAA